MRRREFLTAAATLPLTLAGGFRLTDGFGGHGPKSKCPPGQTTTVTQTVTDTVTVTTAAPTTTEATTTTTTTTTPATQLPAQGFSTSSNIEHRTASDQDFEIAKMLEALNGKPGWVRTDWWPSYPAADMVLAKEQAAGFAVMGLYNQDYGSRTDQATFAANCAALAGVCRFVNVFNEPDMSGWPPDVAASYALAAYQAIKQASPDTVVIGPSLWKTPSQNPADGYAYAKAMLAAAGRFVDVWDMHLYDDVAQVAPSWNLWDWTFRNGGVNIRALLDGNGMADVPIMSTEGGTNVNANGEGYQASSVADGMDARDSLGLCSYGVFTMMNDTGPGGFGLLRDDRSGRPAFAAFQSRSR